MNRLLYPVVPRAPFRQCLYPPLFTEGGLTLIYGVDCRVGVWVKRNGSSMGARCDELLHNIMASIIQHNYHSGFLSRASPTAVCLAGETRSFALEPVRTALASNLLSPLRADLFLVLSKRWQGKDLTSMLSNGKLLSFARELKAVGVVVAEDAAMLDTLVRLLGSNATLHGSRPSSAAAWSTSNGHELSSILDCTSRQALPRKVINDARDGGPGDRYRFTNDQLGECSPQLSLTLRWRSCLALIERAELKRAAPYTWVVRSRPDVGIPCALTLDAFLADAVLYTDDYIAMMPRAAANASLRQVPLAHHSSASECYEYMMATPSIRALTTYDEGRDAAFHHTSENCNRCVVGMNGWRTGTLAAFVWQPETHQYVRQTVAYPTRAIPNRSGHMVPEPFPPFGTQVGLHSPPLFPRRHSPLAASLSAHHTTPLPSSALRAGL